MELLNKGKASGKSNKKNKKVTEEFKAVKKSSKDFIVNQYIKFKYHVFGIKFFKYWYQTHPKFDVFAFNSFLKIEAIQIHKMLFDNGKSIGFNQKKSKNKIK